MLAAKATRAPSAQSFPDYLQDDAARVASRRLGHIRVVPNQNWAALAPLAQFIGGCEFSSPCIRQTLPVGANVAAAGLSIRQFSGSRRSADIAKRDKQAFQYRCHAAFVHLKSLSSSAAFAGFQTSEATNGRVPRTQRAFHENEGELPNVGC